MNSNMYTVRLVIDHIICNRIRALLTVNLLASQIELHCFPFSLLFFVTMANHIKRTTFQNDSLEYRGSNRWIKLMARLLTILRSDGAPAHNFRLVSEQELLHAVSCDPWETPGVKIDVNTGFVPTCSIS